MCAIWSWLKLIHSLKQSIAALFVTELVIDQPCNTMDVMQCTIFFYNNTTYLKI